MRTWRVDGILVVAIVLGGGWAWVLSGERSRLESACARLERRTGDLVVDDPRLIHLRALATAGPLRFGWRLALPPVQLSFRARFGRNTTTGHSNGDREMVIRVAFREEAGKIKVWTQTRGENLVSGSTTTLDDDALVGILRDHWDEILVEQAGTNGVATADPQEPLTLLRLTLPPSLVEAARLRDPGSMFVPVLYELAIP